LLNFFKRQNSLKHHSMHAIFLKRNQLQVWP
jgi:hypothetical protein